MREGERDLEQKKLWIQLSGLFLLAVDLEVIVYGICILLLYANTQYQKNNEKSTRNLAGNKDSFSFSFLHSAS